ncbi:DUF488 family protein [Eggerthellaceae bacterium zg-997]|nr:DUF488 family protein [Eggerthellaceae bacterium zg-997]
MVVNRIQVKRVYDPAEPTDGYRMLVDRLWPRGMRKDALPLDEWAKDLAPSSDLRRAWHDGDIPTDEFQRAYAGELDGSDALIRLYGHILEGPVTLLVATRSPEASHAHVIVDALERLFRQRAMRHQGGPPGERVRLVGRID